MALEILGTESKLLGLKVSWINTKILVFVFLFNGNIDFPPSVTVQGENGCFRPWFSLFCYVVVKLIASEPVNTAV